MDLKTNFQNKTVSSPMICIKQGITFKIKGEGTELTLPPSEIVVAATEEASVLVYSLVKELSANSLGGIKSLQLEQAPYRRDLQNATPVTVSAGAFPIVITSDLKVDTFAGGGGEEIFFPPESVGTLFGLAEALKGDFLQRSVPYCPCCGKELKKEFDFEDLSHLSSGVLAITFELSVDGALSLRDVLEMFDLNYVVIDGKLLLVDSVEVEPLLEKPLKKIKKEVLAVALTQALPLQDKIGVSEKVKELFKSGLKHLECLYFKTRRDKGEKLCAITQEPYCSDCATFVQGVAESLRENGANCCWRLDNKEVAYFKQATVEELLLWDKRSEEDSPYKSTLKLLSDLGFSTLPLSSEVLNLSRGEVVRVALGVLLSLDLHDCIVIIDRSFSLFTSEEREKYAQILRQFVLNGNTCLVVDDDVWNKKFFDKELLFDGAVWKVAPISQKKSQKNPLKKEVITLNSKGAFLEKIQQGEVIALCGASGGGKTTLLNAISVGDDALLQKFHKIEAPYQDSAKGKTLIEMAGLSDKIAERYAATLAARVAGLLKQDFLLGRGRFICPVCQGRGVSESILSGGVTPCGRCLGGGFTEGVQSVQLNGKNIAEVLNYTVKEATSFFADSPDIYNKLKGLSYLGFGDFCLKTPRLVLSYCETLRISLVNAIFKKRVKKSSTLFLLDDMLSGLSLKKLEEASLFLKKVTQKGDTVVMVSNRGIGVADAVYRVEYVGDR